MKGPLPIARRDFLRTGIGAGGLLIIPASYRGAYPADHLLNDSDRSLPVDWRSVVRIAQECGCELGEMNDVIIDMRREFDGYF
jgi:hypothetical protein